MSKFPDRFIITSDFSELQNRDLDGSRLSVGFRPSGELHLGNLLTLAYSAVIAEKLDLELDLFCCDTDWSAHIHEKNLPENNDVMKLFFNRDCGCQEHRNVAEHRAEEIEPFLKGLEKASGKEVEAKFLTDLQGEKGYTDALRKVLENMEAFDEIFGGGFRRRYRSPIATVCENCGFSHAKGSAFSEETGELVSSCRNPGCKEGFMSGKISEEISVYYLVDPVRDPSRDVAVHVFGGDYRDAKKEQKTSKATKVAKITELATGETPAYFLGPMISDEDGKPLSKSKNTGKTVSEIGDLEKFGEKLFREVEKWLESDREYMPQNEIFEL